MEIREIPLQQKVEFSNLMLHGWEEIMGAIPSSCFPNQMRFNQNHINSVRLAVQNGRASNGMELLLEEWGSMGKSRFPTVLDLLKICLETKQYAAASYIHENILHKETIDESNADSILETLSINVHRDFDANELQETDSILESELIPELNSAFIGHPVAPEHGLGTHRVRFSYLFSITNGFSKDPIGIGGFAEVYKGETHNRKIQLAIKKLKVGASEEDKERMEKQLNYEVDQVERLRHPNIIDLLGYSNDGGKDRLCLIYPYMKDGTLKDQLLKKQLTAQQRLKIIKGVAEGLKHLHYSNPSKPLVHRDIKPANILLDSDMTPKIADFGLLRHGAMGDDSAWTETVHKMGTNFYMPSEAFRGDVSCLWDVWSYGVVLLEILTSLPVYCATRPDRDLVTHIDNLPANHDATELFDASAHWDLDVGMSIYHIAREKCLKEKQERATIITVIEDLSQLHQ